MSTLSHKIRLDVDIINIRFLDMDTVSNIKHSDSDTDRFQPL